MNDHPMKPTLPNISIPLIAASLLLTGCKDEGQDKRIKELEVESADRFTEIETLGHRLQEAENELNKVRDSLDEAKREARVATDELTRVQRQLEIAKKNEDALRESTRKKTASNPIEEAKKVIEEKISSLWSIQGDQASCHGVAAEADGKTWLYMPANGLGGSTKITVKDTAGNTITKFGEFQVAADAALARLEIKEEVPNRFVIDPAATLGENPRLIFANPAEGAGAAKLEESRPGAITAADLEFTAYGSKDTSGCPIFNGETGALLGIVLPGKAAATGIWDVPQRENTGLLRATRVGRTIDWKTATIGAVLAERRKIDELNKMSRLVEAASALSPGASGINLDAAVPGGSQTARQIFEENKDLPAVQELLKFNDGLKNQRVRVSESDIKRQVGSVFGQLGNASRRTATEVRAMKPSPANRAEMETALKWYDEAEKKLAATLAGAGR